MIGRREEIKKTSETTAERGGEIEESKGDKRCAEARMASTLRKRGSALLEVGG